MTTTTLTQICDGLVVCGATVEEVDRTADRDEQGLLRQDGTHTRLLHGVSPNGEHVLWIETNGGPCAISEDPAEAAATLCALGDSGPGIARRQQVEQGLARLRAAVSALLERHAGSEPAAEQLAWYEDVIAHTRAALADGDLDEVMATW